MAIIEYRSSIFCLQDNPSKHLEQVYPLAQLRAGLSGIDRPPFTPADWKNVCEQLHHIH